MAFTVQPHHFPHRLSETSPDEIPASLSQRGHFWRGVRVNWRRSCDMEVMTATECQVLEVPEPIFRPAGRVSARGKFLFAGDEKLLVKGVTYGAFKPDETGNEYHDLAKIDRDFAAMAKSGVNTV